MVKVNRGRRKIEIKRIVNDNTLQVTFSKRRFGIFKKASELCTLCGAEILMILFSPGGKVFSFAHPNAKDLIGRFFNPSYNSFISNQQNNNLQLVETYRDRHIQHLNNILGEGLIFRKKEKHNRMVLDMLRESRKQRRSWFEKDVKELNMNETNNLISALQEVKNGLVSEMSQHSQVTISQNYFGENSGFGRDVEVGINHLNQRRNTLNYNANMALPNHTPFFGYKNDEVTMPRSNIDYMSSHNFN